MTGIHRERPGAGEVAAATGEPAIPLGDDVWCSPGTSYSYALTTDDGRVIVNAGLVFEGPLRQRAYADIPGPTRAIIVTQGHADHWGAVNALAAPDTEVVFPSFDVPSDHGRVMKVSTVIGPGTAELVDTPIPQVGPRDVLVKMRACGICGSDAFYVSIGGIPPRQGRTPLGHEPAGEVSEVGAAVEGVEVGDHVVINPMASPSGIIGNGGATGALAEYLIIENAARGTSFEVIPDHVPFEVAALNEPMAVARHGVNRCRPKPSDKVVVFGAGPIGLGATLAFRSVGVHHIVVVDLIGRRLEKALSLGADAVIDASTEDVGQRLIDLHGAGESLRAGKAGTDTYFDAAGSPAVLHTALAAAKKGATLGITAVHNEPVPVDFVNVMSNELTIVGSMGYPDEIFEVTTDLVANWQKYALIVSHTIPFADVDVALALAATPGAADKVVVTFE